jgi:hypothetical protein
MTDHAGTPDTRVEVCGSAGACAAGGGTPLSPHAQHATTHAIIHGRCMARDPITRDTVPTVRLAIILGFASALAGAAGCAAATAEDPLTIGLAIPRDVAETQLHAHQYCRTSIEPPAAQEVYPRCDRPGTEWGDSWVVARYVKDQLVELRRWERYADDNHAVERWNQLVSARSHDGTELTTDLRQLGLLEPGTRAVKAYQLDAHTVAAVYLLQPSPPENANVLEKVSMLPAAPTR